MRFRLASLFVALSATTALAQSYTPQGYMPQGYGVPAAGAGISPTASPYYTDTGAGFSSPSTYGAVGSTANTDLLGYGLLEGFYQYNTFKNENIDASHGLGVALTAELFEPFFMRGSFSWGAGNGKGFKEGYDMSTIQVGGGAYFAVANRFHIVGEVGGLYSTLSADSSQLSFSDGALYIRPGVRFAPTDSVELNAAMQLTSADDYNSRVFDVNAYYRLFTQMDVGLGAGFGDNQNGYRAGVRFRW
jgi:hypothetical protein